VEARELARSTEGRTGADIELICQRAGLLAARDFLDGNGEGKDVAGLAISRDKLMLAIQEVTRSGPKVG
jgi:SpoVK/Ycf46/Vps4 family AAA+-type ATPase